MCVNIEKILFPQFINKLSYQCYIFVLIFLHNTFRSYKINWKICM